VKPNQCLAYAERINRVIALLEESDFEAVPSLEAMASAAALSPYHFHRVFRLMTGETPTAAIRRIRLARALPDLAAETSVTVAAASSGYATSQSFARALRETADTSATELRADPARLDRLSAQLRSPGEKARGAPLEVRVVSLEPFRLLALRNLGDYAELNGAYARLFDAVLTEVEPEDLQGIYGVPHDDPRFVPADHCRFDCALAVGEAGSVAGGLAELWLGGGEFLSLRHLGDYDQLHETIDLAYVAAITGTTREIAASPLFIHYLDDPEEVAEADLRSDIYLPLA
jgi:AraC family transcriptional regulator